MALLFCISMYFVYIYMEPVPGFFLNYTFILNRSLLHKISNSIFLMSVREKELSKSLFAGFSHTHCYGAS